MAQVQQESGYLFADLLAILVITRRAIAALMVPLGGTQFGTAHIQLNCRTMSLASIALKQV